MVSSISEGIVGRKPAGNGRVEQGTQDDVKSRIGVGRSPEGSGARVTSRHDSLVATDGQRRAERPQSGEGERMLE